MKNEPSIIVVLTGDTVPRKIGFYDIFKYKQYIKTIIFLYDFNSYLINVEEGYFCINGGRRIKPNGCDEYEDRQLKYAKRNTKEVDLTDGHEATVRTNYILGLTGILGNEIKNVLIQISEDGLSWNWRDSL
jgi:hypothetical protein